MTRFKQELLLTIGVELQQIDPETEVFIRELERIIMEAKARLPMKGYIPPPLPPYEQTR